METISVNNKDDITNEKYKKRNENLVVVVLAIC